MANRGDFEHSTLPRYLKRVFAGSRFLGDEHHQGQVKRAFINAHAAHKEWRKKMLASKYVDTNEEYDVVTPPPVRE